MVLRAPSGILAFLFFPATLPVQPAGSNSGVEWLSKIPNESIIDVRFDGALANAPVQFQASLGPCIPSSNASVQLRESSADNLTDLVWITETQGIAAGTANSSAVLKLVNSPVEDTNDLSIPWVGVFWVVSFFLLSVLLHIRKDVGGQ